MYVLFHVTNILDITKCNEQAEIAPRLGVNTWVTFTGLLFCHPQPAKKSN